MAILLYMDHHVPRVITVELRLRGVDVLTAYEDGVSTLDDVQLLDRTTFCRFDSRMRQLPNAVHGIYDPRSKKMRPEPNEHARPAVCIQETHY